MGKTENLVDWDDHERSAGTSVNERDELRVDIAEQGVPGDLGDSDVGHAALVLDWLTENMSKFTLSHNLSHLKSK